MTAPGRYAGLPVRTWTAPDGSEVTYVPPRILPPAATLPPGTVAVVGAGERHRLDLLAYRTLGDPLLAYLIADANDAMDPFALCAEPGRTLRVPGPPL